MGVRARRAERLSKLGLVVSGDSKTAVVEKSATQSNKRCSWSSYSDQYPHGVVIGPLELSLAKGLAANGKAPTVITGETGTGKEVLAKLMHNLRCEREGRIPFVAVNCATITENLCESLLFGHRRGAFTGAESSTNGYIHDANGGILFLDEVHALSIPVQQKLLRVMNDGTYNRLGETAQLRSSFQLVAASTKDLDDEVDANRFILDLRSRLTGIDINLLPLRDRKADIPALLARRLTDNDTSIGNRLFDQLVCHVSGFHWRGNIRQLFKAVDNWILMSKVMNTALSIDSFPEFKGMRAQIEKCQTLSPVQHDSVKNMDFFNTIIKGRNLVDAVDALELFMIKEALKKTRTIGNAAEVLGIPRSTLDTKRRKFGIARDDADGLVYEASQTQIFDVHGV